MLRRQLLSVLAQTLRPHVVHVFDNDSAFSAKSVVEQYADQGARYVNTAHLGRAGNALALRKAAVGSKWMAVFHDDDAIAPGYLESALRVLEAIDGVNLLSCVQKPMPAQGLVAPSTGIDTHGIILSVPEMATLKFDCGLPPYPFAIYRTECYLAQDPFANHETYGRADVSAAGIVRHSQDKSAVAI